MENGTIYFGIASETSTLIKGYEDKQAHERSVMPIFVTAKSSSALTIAFHPPECPAMYLAMYPRTL